MHPTCAPMRSRIINTLWWLIILRGLFLTSTLCAFPQKLGDLDGDGQATVLDLVRMVNQINGTAPLGAQLALFADMNQDGLVNEADVNLLTSVILGVAPLLDFPLTRVRQTSPMDGEIDVSVTRETIFHFTQPLSSNTLITTADLHANFGERQILSRVELSSNLKTVTLFYLEPLPASALVRVTFDGTALADWLGRPVDMTG